MRRGLRDALPTDMRAFQKLAPAQPLFAELREWSRKAEGLNAEPNRPCDRLSEQLRRYFPVMLLLQQGLGVVWFLALWELVPTLDKATRSIARTLKSRCIRRLTAAEGLTVLRSQR
jgi:hypothetical protein